MSSARRLPPCAGLALAACQAASPTASRPAPEPAPGGTFEEERLEQAREGREWFSLGLVIADRAEDDGALVEDGGGFSLDGGYELTRTPLRPSIEIGGAWSVHEVEGVSGDLDVMRISMGVRLALHDLGVPLLPYARAGAFHRWAYDDEEDLGLEDQSGRGWYVGAGLDWITEPGVAFGPFFTSYEGAEDELEERFYGLEASFRF